MTFVITRSCCNDASCVPVCPVQCIRPRPGDPDFATAEQLYIDPGTCIDCGACVAECPVDAIYVDEELPDHLAHYRDINAEYFAINPIEDARHPATVQRTLPADRPRIRVAVVGAGPAGLYTTAELAAVPGVAVSLFERLPTPFGLARAGVAPDHQETRDIAGAFRSVLAQRTVHCYFNIRVGEDITIEELLGTHDAVIWAAGADDDRRLGIPGEDLPGSVPAREFVAWYNGHPYHAAHTYDFSGERAVIIGNGNVALDVARILARPAADFEHTEMADHAIEALRRSDIREVVVVGRRGPEHAAFTSGEALALEHLDGVDLLAEPDETRPSAQEHPFPVRRKLDVAARAAARTPTAGNRRIVLRFGLTPVRIEGSQSVSAVTFRRTNADQTETIKTGLVLRAVGYRGREVPGLPFDEERGVVPNDRGRVTEPATGTPLPGVYCVGWIKRGPSGGIGANKIDAAETVETLLTDLAAGTLPTPPGGPDDLEELLRRRELDVVDFAAWSRIDAAEEQRGAAHGRPRSVLVTVAELMEASRTN